MIIIIIKSRESCGPKIERYDDNARDGYRAMRRRPIIRNSSSSVP